MGTIDTNSTELKERADKIYKDFCMFSLEDAGKLVGLPRATVEACANDGFELADSSKTAKLSPLDIVSMVLRLADVRFNKVVSYFTEHPASLAQLQMFYAMYRGRVTQTDFFDKYTKEYINKYSEFICSRIKKLLELSDVALNCGACVPQNNLFIEDLKNYERLLSTLEVA